MRKTPQPEPTLLQQRRSTHGHFEDNAEITDQCMYILQTSTGWHDAPAMVRVAAFMIVHKLARALSGSVLFDDHWKDIAGYATLIVDSTPCKTTSQPTQHNTDSH